MATNYCNTNHILIGLGGTGGKILRDFKKRMFEEFPKEEVRSKLPVSLLYVDSSDEMMPQNGKIREDFRVMGKDASFTQSEFLYIKSVDVNEILEHIDNYQSLKGIVKDATAVKRAIGDLGHAAGQKRRAGRLLFAANIQGYVNAVKKAFVRCIENSGNENELFIHIFAGLAGGTGSGSIIDAVVQTRKIFPDANISVYAMIPEMTLPKPDMDQGRYYPNGYAALRELNALQTGRFRPYDITGSGPSDAFEINPKANGVANGITLYSNVNENGVSLKSLDELPREVADYVYARIFLINSTEPTNEDILRAYNYENMDGFEFEFDELATVTGEEQIPISRTKKVTSFGLKRVIYPELRILRHIAYTIGERVLWQLKYNNWRDNQGYVDEVRQKDYRKAYLTDDNLARWKMDFKHLTLEEKVLAADEEEQTTFNEYWHDKAIGYAEEAKSASCPLNELDNIMNEFFRNHFREEGVESYFRGKERMLAKMGAEVRGIIERDLFKLLKQGDVSIVELREVSRVLLEYIAEIRQDLETKLKEEQTNYEAVDNARINNVDEWSHLNILERMVGKGAQRYADHQNILTEYYTSKTMLIAWNFSKLLASTIQQELTALNKDISAFEDKMNSAIEKTEKQIFEQRKKNKGLEDTRGAIIEVSEEEKMVNFEASLAADKTDMPSIAQQMRESIFNEEFKNFGILTYNFSNDRLISIIETELTEIVERLHDQRVEVNKKVLGLNILSQLRQKLTSDEDIRKFAQDVIDKSGIFLKRNQNEINKNVPNNEQPTEEMRMASINKRSILVSVPNPGKGGNLKEFSDKLEREFKASIRQENSITTINFNTSSPRENELSIVTINYCYPMRCADWLRTYKERYHRFLGTGNPAKDRDHAILLHSEGDGKDLPSLFVVDKPKEEKNLDTITKVPPVIPTGPTPPPITHLPIEEPIIQLYIAVAGQQYGPFDYQQCKQMVQTGQLNKQSLVWMEGMAAWQSAGEVEKLNALFAPVPPIPPTTPGMPPMPPVM